MPATRFSVLDSKPTTDLRPGETGIRLKDDPYYGKVDLGPAPMPADEKAKEFEKTERARIATLPADQRPAAEEKLAKETAKRREGIEPHEITPGDATPELIAKVEALQEQIVAGMHALDGEEQNHVEVITGKRLQQKTLEPRPPEPEVDGEGGTPVAAAAAKKAPVPRANA